MEIQWDRIEIEIWIEFSCIRMRVCVFVRACQMSVSVHLCAITVIALTAEYLVEKKSSY